VVSGVMSGRDFCKAAVKAQLTGTESNPGMTECAVLQAVFG